MGSAGMEWDTGYGISVATRVEGMSMSGNKQAYCKAAQDSYSCNYSTLPLRVMGGRVTGYNRRREYGLKRNSYQIS